MNHIVTNINNFIYESITDIVYHFTHTSRLFKILKDNRFLGTFTHGSSADYKLNNERPYFFSTTRSKSSGYNHGEVKLKLNGRLLSHNYKSKPIDYWENMGGKDEMEDRIILNQPYINNAIKYIEEIHILVIGKYNYENIIKLADENNIPIYFYDLQRDWLNENKKRQIPLNKVKNKDYSEIEYRKDLFYISDFLKIAYIIAYNDENSYNKIINFLDEKYSEKFKSGFEYFKKFNLPLIKDTNGFHFKDYYNSIKSTIHNNRSSNEKHFIFLFKLLSKSIKLSKYNNFTSYIKGKVKSGQYLKVKSIYEKVVKKIEEVKKENIKTLNFDIELNGKYYKAYKVPTIMNEVNNYILKLKEYIKDTLINNDYIFKYSYLLGIDELKKVINLKGVKVDGYNDYDKELTESIKRMLRFIIFDIGDFIYYEIKKVK